MKTIIDQNFAGLEYRNGRFFYDGDLVIDGDCQIAVNLEINGDLHVAGNLECYRSVTVSGDVTAQNIDANYDLTCYRVTVRGSIKAETIVAKNQLNATSVRAGTIRTKQISRLNDLICVHLVTYPPIYVTREIDVVGGIYPPEESIY